MYNFNVCSTVACYDATAGIVAAQVPILATEIGVDNCDATFLNAFMSWLDAKQLSYLAWTWNAWGTACSTFSLINDYAGSPTSYGELYRSHLSLAP